MFVAQDRDRYEKERVQARVSDRAMFAERVVGIVGHDLRNPIMGMLTSAELLDNGGVTPNQSAVLARILRAGDWAHGEPSASVVTTSVRKAAFASILMRNRGWLIPTGTMDGLLERTVRGGDEANRGWVCSS